MDKRRKEIEIEKREIKTNDKLPTKCRKDDTKFDDGNKRKQKKTKKTTHKPTIRKYQQREERPSLDSKPFHQKKKKLNLEVLAFAR